MVDSSLSVATLAMQAAERWAQAERDNARSIPGDILKDIDKAGKLRLPQIKAIETHLWLKFAGGNRTLTDIVVDGLLTDDNLAKEYGYENRPDLKDSPVRQFFIAFAKSHRFGELERIARDDPRTDEAWRADLRKLLRDYPYPNRLYSLPMGAGKTYLMAAFIYLDLHLSRIMPDDPRFAHNFIVLAPHSAKTAILPSLKTIREFDPCWVLPADDAKKVRQEIHVEVLDSFSSGKKSLRVENPNLDRVNRLSQMHQRGLVFVTNAEKVVLEQYNPDSMGMAPLDDKKKEQMARHNALRDRMAEIPVLGVFLDEAHHTYTTTDKEQKKLRTAVEVLNSKGNLREVNGFSGTPFIKTRMEIAGQPIKPTQLQDVLYHFPLAVGIGQFLKTPNVRWREDVREDQFIHAALDEFFEKYDYQYDDGTRSKIAFYCPTVKALNEEIRPTVRKWYEKHRLGKDAEILTYYSSDTGYPLSPKALADFHNLDSPHSDKRVVLLVAVGKEGWDCRSLTAVALPRHTTTKNFVLQTSCRCLREVTDATKERALIYLGKDNYRLLQEQLEAIHRIGIDEFQSGLSNHVPVLKRKPHLGKLKYKQIDNRLIVETNHSEHDPAQELKAFKLRKFMERDEYQYEPREGEGSIRESGSLSGTQHAIAGNGDDATLERYEDFLIELQRALWGLHTAAELNQRHGTELSRRYQEYKKEHEWFAKHREGGTWICRQWVRAIAACFVAETQYRREELLEDVNIDLLEWGEASPSMARRSGNFLPEIRSDFQGLRNLRDKPEFIENLLEHEGHDPQNISFNYAPYQFDSGFEKRALLEMLQESDLKDKAVELYYNGMTDPNLNSFVIRTPHGRYTPDFLLLRREGDRPYDKSQKRPARITHILIIETKGKAFYDENFKAKEKFIKETFMKHNPHIHYINFVDEGNKGDFNVHMNEFRNTLSDWLEKSL